MEVAEFRLGLRLLLGDEIALGPGKAELIERIARTGSISAAAREMGMSYTRAWKLVRTMNACFVMRDAALEPAFDALWKEAGISGIRGHRSVGGYRASMYNALPIESVKALTDVMEEFAKKNG